MEKPSASKSSEAPAPKPAPRSGPAKKAPRPWGPLSKRKPTVAAEAPDTAAATENQTDKAYIEEFAAPECFVDIDAKMQAQMEKILAKGPKSKGILVLPSEQDVESDEDTTSVIITHDWAEKIANSVESLEAENHGADDQEGFNQSEVAPENVPGPTDEPTDVGNADDFYQNLRFDLEMAKMDNSGMELDLHLSDANDPVVDENIENIPIIENNDDDGGLFPGGHLSVGKKNAAEQDCDDVFVDIENIDGE
ncbi:hypothetical protein AAVH_11909 [Aphelenchoides avenae]|nr:hypothetical protein AAVH_11909 [Aphelenchus avenae]